MESSGRAISARSVPALVDKSSSEGANRDGLGGTEAGYDPGLLPFQEVLMGMDEQRFQAQRRSGIGGSDAAGVLGISPWVSRLGVWEEKVGLRPPNVPTERMLWGTRLEEAVAQGYAEDFGVKVRKVGFRRHGFHPFVIGHPDRSLGSEGMEIKTLDHLTPEWGEEGSDVIPAHYWAQVQHYSYLMGWEVVRVAVLVRGNELHSYTVPADPAFQESLVEEERVLWVDHVLTGIPPDPDGSEDAGQVILRLHRQSMIPDRIVATPQVNAMGLRLLEVQDQIAVLEREERELKNRISAYIRLHAGVTGDGWSATWSNRKGSIGWKTVAESYRRLIERTAFDLLGRQGPLLLADGVRLSDDEDANPGGVRIESMDALGKFLDTVEGLYRGEGTRQFRAWRKGMEESNGE